MKNKKNNAWKTRKRGNTVRFIPEAEAEAEAAE
jgi:hypothetical protein